MWILTKEQRLERYKIALEFMEKYPDDAKLHGLCYAVTNGVGHSSFYPNSRCDMKYMYPEIWKHRPHISAARLEGYWWSTRTESGYSIRISILKKIIKDMEG